MSLHCRHDLVAFVDDDAAAAPHRRKRLRAVYASMA
jgi:hypothetical protein